MVVFEALSEEKLHECKVILENYGYVVEQLDSTNFVAHKGVTFLICYLLTGSHGFIGSAVRRLIEEENDSAIYADLKNGKDLSDRRTYETLREEIARIDDDLVIIHLAALVDARESIDVPFRYFGNNLAATYHFAQLGILENVRNCVYKFRCSLRRT